LSSTAVELVAVRTATWKENFESVTNVQMPPSGRAGKLDHRAPRYQLALVV
jgi:hypothetical protein